MLHFAFFLDDTGKDYGVIAYTLVYIGRKNEIFFYLFLIFQGNEPSYREDAAHPSVSTISSHYKTLRAASVLFAFSMVLCYNGRRNTMLSHALHIKRRTAE